MRKILAAALVLGLFVSAGFASGAADYGITDAVYEYRLDTTISSSAAFDSIIGNATPADSIAVLTNWSPKMSGWEYVLVRDTVTCSDTDSLKASVIVKCENSAGSKLYEFAADTLSGQAGEAYELDIGGAAIGNQFDIIFRAIAATERANQIIFNRIYLYARRPLLQNKRP